MDILLFNRSETLREEEEERGIKKVLLGEFLGSLNANVKIPTSLLHSAEL